MAGHSETSMEISGCRIGLKRGGAGEPLLFLHGASGAGAWLPFMESLAENFDVIVPEHPGFGASDTPAWLDNMADLTYFYLDFLEAMGLDRVHLVGLSLGGWLAAELAVRNTGRLESLTLVSAAGIHLKGVPQLDTFLCSDEERIRGFFYDQELAQATVQRLLAPELEDVTLKNRFISAKLLWQPRAYNPNLYKWLHRITVPTLIAWGDSDRLFPKEYAAEFHRLIPGSEIVVFPECGHLPNVEKADEFVDAVTSFAKGVSG